jgi:hypothetical protein
MLYLWKYELSLFILAGIAPSVHVGTYDLRVSRHACLAPALPVLCEPSTLIHSAGLRFTLGLTLIACGETKGVSLPLSLPSFSCLLSSHLGTYLSAHQYIKPQSSVDLIGFVLLLPAHCDWLCFYFRTCI